MTTIEEIKEECRQIIALAESEHLTPGHWNMGGTGSTMREGYSQPFGIVQTGTANLVAGIFGDGRGGEDAARANASFIAASRSFTPRAAQAVLVAIQTLENINANSLEISAEWAHSVAGLELVRRAWEGSK